MLELSEVETQWLEQTKPMFNASNPSGLVHDFFGLLGDLRFTTNPPNQHPLIVLWHEKIGELLGLYLNDAGQDRWEDAYRWYLAHGGT